MLAFAERKPHDPKWRNFAFAYAKKTGDVEPLRYFRGDDEVFQYLLSLANRLERNRSEHAIRMLPWIGGSRAKKPLLSIIDAAIDGKDEFAAVTAIEALERAAHLRIEPDGTTSMLAANSDTPEYSDEEFDEFTRHADFDTLRKISAQWHRRLQ